MAKKITDEQFIKKFKEFIADKYGEQKIAASAWVMKPPYITQIINGTKPAPKAVLDDMGMKRVVKTTKWYELL